MDLILELDQLRRDAKAAAQRSYVEALVAGNVDAAVALLPVSQHGTLERALLGELGLAERYDALIAAAEEASLPAQADREQDRAPVYERVAEKEAAEEAP